MLKRFECMEHVLRFHTCVHRGGHYFSLIKESKAQVRVGSLSGIQVRVYTLGLYVPLSPKGSMLLTWVIMNLIEL